jgi:glycerol-3-phosphate acyltransferase PlsX
VALPIAVDAMGGDRAPAEVLEGCRRARDTRGERVLLVGRPEVVQGQGFEAIEASETIAMDEDPAQAVRRKKDSSLVRAAEAVRDGRAAAMVSAGNTGAAMAAALFRFGRLKGVTRPAIATLIPVPGGRPTVLLDSGANAECQPEWLVQFARMGSCYARVRLAIEHPRVGLMSIGEEAGKGSPLVKTANELLDATPDLRFVGNVEGRDVMGHEVDVVVTDGFTGNVILKTLEGSVNFAMAEVRRRLAGLAGAEILEPLYAEVDPETYGGAMLLGVDGVCVISHGSSSARAIDNAITTARELVDLHVVDALRGPMHTDRAEPAGS